MKNKSYFDQEYMDAVVGAIPVHEITLKKIKSYCDILISKLRLEEMDAGLVSIESIRPQVRGALIRLKQEVWAEKVEDTTKSYETYASWWDHFKDTKFPQWLKKRYPVKKIKHKIRFKRYAKFPQLLLNTNYEDQKIVWLDSIEREF